MPMGPESFTSAHRRSIGVALKLIHELIRGVRAEGVDAEALTELHALMAELAAATGAKPPTPRGSELNAKLAQILVHALELDSRHLRAYAELSDDAVAYLDEQSRRLGELTMRLFDEVASDPRRRSGE
jgi:hypothetical protein